MLGATSQSLEDRLKDPRYDPLLPLPLAESVDEDTAVYLKERAEDYPGVEVDEGWQRVYRYSPIASHIVGYIGRIPDKEAKDYKAQGYQLSDTVGRSGIELSFEEDLRGTPGYVKYEVDARGQVVEELERVDPVPGRDVQLSIDLKVQQYAEQMLDAGLKEARNAHTEGRAQRSSSRHRPARSSSRTRTTGRSWPWPRTRRSTTACSSVASATRSTRSSSATVPATRW